MNLVLPISKLFHTLQTAITHKIAFYYIYSNIQKYNNDKMYFHTQHLTTIYSRNFNSNTFSFIPLQNKAIPYTFVTLTEHIIINIIVCICML